MLKKIFLKEKLSKICGFLLLIFFAFGIFLRTYNFHDWLRFNADQSRDAAVVDNFLEGRTELPLLGPKAGGTDFRLGPAFYYFQIASAKMFGQAPDKMAYFDLLFSVLAIPLLYLLMRKYFDGRISVALAALFSVSMFAVQYSRFAWNPNSSPFFVLLFLYSLLMMADSETKKKFFWAASSGIALGIGIQLHTLLLIAMPIVTLIFLEYAYKTTKNTFTKEFGIVLLFALIMNVPQILGEFQGGGHNVRAFFAGTVKKTSNETGIGEKLAENFLCQIQGNNYIISAVGPSGDCGKTVISGELKRHKHFDKKMPIIFETIFGLIFTIGGLFLWLRAVSRESDRKKKEFLVLLGLYFLATFFLLIFLANEISIRFYLALIFVPFLLLGLWIEALLRYEKVKHKKQLIAAIFLIFILLMGSNVCKTSKMFAAFSSQGEVEDDGVDNDSDSFITLSEAEFVANHIVSHADNQQTVYLGGRQQYLFKYARSIRYLTRKKGIDIKEYSEKENLPEGASIMVIGDSENIGKLDASIRENYSISDVEFFGRFSVAKLQRK